ncbi:hypothetical protein NFO65_18550 [Neorhizobium galegae]|uniref:hypothetical protein n=1 Tax=Neorhizobium galegae TaxID=399 RepID=UPI002101ABD8|nr:hypothetical protein [Neorhizobium galegae]MCQ1572732.1 hypothetical protein [Neorhizobium galegae]
MHDEIEPISEFDDFDTEAQRRYLRNKHTGSRSHDIGDDFEAFLIMVVLVTLAGFVRLGKKDASEYRIVQHAEEWIDDVNVLTPTRKMLIHSKSGQTKGTWSKNLQRDFRHQPLDKFDGRLVSRELVAPTERMRNLLVKNTPADLAGVRIRVLDIERMANESWEWWFLDRSLERVDVLNHRSEMLYERMWAQVFGARFCTRSTDATLAETFGRANRHSGGAIASLQPPNPQLVEIADALDHIEGLSLAVNGETLIYRYDKSYGRTLETHKVELKELEHVDPELPTTIPGFLVWIGAF